MVLHSYGMLLPCGIDKFHGTEYVCCPSSRAGESAPPSLPSQEDDDEEEEVEDEEIDEADLIEEENRWVAVKQEGKLPRVCVCLCYDRGTCFEILRA